MKRKKGCLFYILVFSIVLLALLIVHEITRNKYTHTSIIVAHNLSSGKIVHFNDKYLFSKNDGIYAVNNETPVIKTDKVMQLYATDSYLYACDYESGTVVEYDCDYAQTNEINLNTDIKDFAVALDHVVFVDSKDNYHIMRLQDNAEVTDFEMQSFSPVNVSCYYNDQFKIFVSEEFSGVSVFACNNPAPVLEYRDKYANYVPYVSDKFAVISSTTNGSIHMYTYQFETGEIMSNVKPASQCLPVSLRKDKEQIVFIGFQEPADPHMPPSEYPILKNHRWDCVNVIDSETFEFISSNKTKKYERIIYADENKAITFYSGNYLTYSLEDWEVIDKQKADEIKDGGSYTFETCGEYIFVFDDDTGELLNTISVA